MALLLLMYVIVVLFFGELLLFFFFKTKISLTLILVLDVTGREKMGIHGGAAKGTVAAWLA